MTHQQIDARSLEMHQIIADRIEADPSLREKALAILDRWQQDKTAADPYYEKWRALLNGPLADLLAMMRSSSEEATAMRQAAPFAGPTFIAQEERLILIKKYAAY
jgi:hypothetical protein